MIPTYRVDLVADASAEVGEGPRWDDRSGVLVWVDIHGRSVHLFDPATGADSAADVGARVGAAALRAGGGYVLVLPGALAAWRPGGEPEVILQVEADEPGRRFNDAACDPAGRLLAGSMHTGENGQGRLYAIDPSGARLLADGIGLPNGLDWSPDGRTLYFTDSLSGEVGAFAYDPDVGAVGRRTGGFPVPAGLPDGHTVDAEGNLWVALWSAGQVVRLTPAGDVVARVEVPVAAVTSCAFGGADLSTLYVTTMRDPDTDGRVEPHAGGLFACSVPAMGRQPHRYAG